MPTPSEKVEDFLFIHLRRIQHWHAAIAGAMWVTEKLYIEYRMGARFFSWAWRPHGLRLGRDAPADESLCTLRVGASFFSLKPCLLFPASLLHPLGDSSSPSSRRLQFPRITSDDHKAFIPQALSSPRGSFFHASAIAIVTATLSPPDSC